MTVTNAIWTSGSDDEGARSSSPNDVQPRHPMFSWYAQGFSDPLGDRLLLFDNTSGEPLELLRLSAHLSRVPGFEALVRERAARLEDFVDPRHARVCRVDRLPEPGGGLALVSTGTQGRRLAEILRLAEEHHLQPSGEIVQRLVEDLVEAMARFHAIGPDVAHGALGPERVIVAPGGQVLVTEYVLGSALPRVPLERSALWRRLRLALPSDPAVPAFDQRTDVVQVGTITLALVLGRMLRDDEYPGRVDELLAEAGDRVVLGGWGRFAEPFLTWLRRMLQVDRDRAIACGIEASRSLREVVSIDGDEQFGSAAIDAFIRACGRRPDALAAGHATASFDSPPAPPALPPATTPRAPRIDPAAVFPALLAEEVAGVAAETTCAAVPPPSFAGSSERAVGPAFARAFGGIGWRQAAVVFVVIIAAAAGALMGERAVLTRQPVTPSSGIVSIESMPTRATVTVDGKRVGATPVKLALAPGRHVLDVSAGNRHRTIAVTTVAGTSASHHVDLPDAPAEVGKLRVVTAPSGGRVLVDGQPRGISPIVVDGLSAGSHEIIVESRQGSVRQTVAVEQNSTASVFVPLPGAAAPAPGWLSIAAPIELSVYENSEIVGTSRTPRIMLPAGHHQLQLVAEDLGFRATRDVQVPIGKTAMLEVTPPDVKIDINALPWAEVSIDDRPVGETPLGGVTVPIGRHLVKFRHPQLGERTVECKITPQGPLRVGADLRK